MIVNFYNRDKKLIPLIEKYLNEGGAKNPMFHNDNYFQHKGFLKDMEEFKYLRPHCKKWISEKEKLEKIIQKTLKKYLIMNKVDFNCIDEVKIQIVNMVLDRDCEGRMLYWFVSNSKYIIT